MSKTKKILIITVALVLLVAHLALAGSVIDHARVSENRVFRDPVSKDLDSENTNNPEQTGETGPEDPGLAGQSMANRLRSRGKAPRGRLEGSSIDYDALLANTLGITVEELQGARQDRALRPLLEELDMTPADVKEAVLVEFEEVVQQPLRRHHNRRTG